MRILKQSHSADKSERRTLSDFLIFISLQNIKKLDGGGPFEDINFRKSHSSEKKIERGDPLVGSVCRLRLKSKKK